jgi:DNA-binding response OmpR family regulator
VPIIMLTARSTEDDMLLGLDLGADDYLTKPYSPRELVARIRTVLRRSRKTGASAGAEGSYRIGELEVDSVRHAVRLNGATVECTPAEFRILAALIAEPGRAFSRAQLLIEAFGFDHYALDRTVDVHVMNLRRKIERKAAEPRYLLTVYGVGYKMAEEVPAGDAS